MTRTIVSSAAITVGKASQPLIVTNNPLLVGVTYYIQFAVRDPVNPPGLAFTTGSVHKIGR